ncbi:MAG TPA: DUF5996 family protein [Candidatus Solibacter sp.]
MVESDLYWPALPLDAWQDTYSTLQLWTQIVGKVRMTLSPPLNHWWHATLYVNARGLTTSAIPYGGGTFEIQFDFIEHVLEIRTSDGAIRTLPLQPMAVADFYRSVMCQLHSLGITVAIQTRPQELANKTPFDQDVEHRSYDREYAHRFWRILISTENVMEEFRGRFIGKQSPVHFFWGSFDLACTRFSGRTAPPRAGVISGPAYSHEVISAGFWPGAGFSGPAYYAYAVPKPDGLERERVRPAAAGWNAQLGEFILMYDDVRSAASPRDALLDFLQSTYEAGARLAGWDRAALETEGERK